MRRQRGYEKGTGTTEMVRKGRERERESAGQKARERAPPLEGQAQRGESFEVWKLLHTVLSL